MASSTDLAEYSSPVKRRKVDNGGGHGSISEVAMDPMASETANASPNDDLEGIENLVSPRDRMYAQIRGCSQDGGDRASFGLPSRFAVFASVVARSRRTP